RFSLRLAAESRRTSLELTRDHMAFRSASLPPRRGSGGRCPRWYGAAGLGSFPPNHRLKHRRAVGALSDGCSSPGAAAVLIKSKAVHSSVPADPRFLKE